ncbi:MAG: hypothetical protein AAFV80_06645 [Bacteroidota bacterium]
MSTLANDTAALIIADFGLENQQTEFSDETLLDYTADVIAYLLEKRLEQLFNTLYRLDVDEDKIKWALDPSKHEEPVNVAVAKLVIERQHQRLKTKAAYRPKAPRNWADYQDELQGD